MAARTNQAFDYLLKLIIIGDSGVGKTCILLNYVGDSFQAPHISTIGKFWKYFYREKEWITFLLLNRDRFQNKYNSTKWEECESADLGHSWSRKVPYDNLNILSRSLRCNPGLRCNELRKFWQCAKLDQPSKHPCSTQRVENPSRKQMRHGRQEINKQGARWGNR